MELLDRLASFAADAPDRVAVREVTSGKSLTYRELYEQVARFAAKLKSELPTGAVIMLRSPNVATYHVALLAILSAEMTVFPVPPAIAPLELSALAAKASVAAIIDDELSIDRLEGAGVTDISPAILLQSSGTTGLPKIVRRDSASIDAVSAQMVEAIGIDAADGLLSCLPLCHSYGLEHGLLAPLWAGATVHLASGFDIDVVRRELAAADVTIFPAVPSIYEMLANLHESGERFTALRLAYSAGGPLPASVFERMKDRCGVTVGQLYGATEVGSVTFAHPSHQGFEPASVGRAMKGVELQVDSDQQLLIRSRSMLSHYVGDDSPLTPDGFFPTGDLARIDAQQNLHIIGRLKLLIDVGGLKVNPLEVEQTLAEHPGVGACVVVPVRMSETVSRLKALVIPLRADHPPTMESLRDFARQRLSTHKVPRIFEFRPTLPRSATGKILRHLLAETRMKRAIVFAILMLVGCASKPREPIPAVTWSSKEEAIQILASRAEQVRTVSAQGLMTMRRPDGESVRLDIAMVGDANGRMRLRAWKLGRAVFDLTMNADGVWMLLPDDPSIRKRMRDGQMNVARLADSWDLFNGGFFRRPGLVMQDAGGELRCVGKIEDVTVVCDIDKRTLTPRRYVLRDPQGVEQFSLQLSEYREINSVVYARRYVARSEMGEILIALDEIEINGELADGAFVPAKRAEKLK